MSWYTNALDYADRLANGEWKKEERKEVEKVLSFVGGMHDVATYNFEDDSIDSLYDVFENGYCYYFANILNLAFPALGRIVWIRNRGHIVWQSNFSGICYDISGIYVDYKDGDLVEVGRLGNLLKDFQHTNRVYFSWNPEFDEWCDKYGFKPILAVTIIYKNLPELSGKTYKAWDELYYYIEDSAIKFWEDSNANKKACLHTIEAELRKGKF